MSCVYSELIAVLGNARIYMFGAAGNVKILDGNGKVLAILIFATQHQDSYGSEIYTLIGELLQFQIDDILSGVEVYRLLDVNGDPIWRGSITDRESGAIGHYYGYRCKSFHVSVNGNVYRQFVCGYFPG